MEVCVSLVNVMILLRKSYEEIKKHPAEAECFLRFR